jgi:hypothetical protein
VYAIRVAERLNHAVDQVGRAVGEEAHGALVPVLVTKRASVDAT